METNSTRRDVGRRSPRRSPGGTPCTISDACPRGHRGDVGDKGAKGGTGDIGECVPCVFGQAGALYEECMIVYPGHFVPWTFILSASDGVSVTDAGIRTIHSGTYRISWSVFDARSPSPLCSTPMLLQLVVVHEKKPDKEQEEEKVEKKKKKKKKKKNTTIKTDGITLQTLVPHSAVRIPPRRYVKSEIFYPLPERAVIRLLNVGTVPIVLPPPPPPLRTTSSIPLVVAQLSLKRL